MNEQNPPPYHLERAEFCYRVEKGLLLGCVLILVNLIVAINTNNLLFLLATAIFLTLPLTIAYFVVSRRIRFWEKPYSLYSRTFSYHPQLQSGVRVPIEVEYQFPTVVDTPEVLDRVDAAARDGLNNSLCALYVAPDYEETRNILIQALEEETEALGIEVFRIHVVKIHIPVTVFLDSDHRRKAYASGAGD